MVSFKTFGWRIVELFAAEQQDEPCVKKTTSVRHLCFGSTLGWLVQNAESWIRRRLACGEHNSPSKCFEAYHTCLFIRNTKYEIIFIPKTCFISCWTRFSVRSAGLNTVWL
jgi:hypothetical protein